MEPLAGIFNTAVQRWSGNADFRSGLAAMAWQSVLGPEVAAHVQLARLDRGVAWVRTTSPVWAHQVTFLKADILRRLAEKLGPKAITDLRIDRSLAMPAERPTPEPPPPELSFAEQAAVTACAQQVADPQLQRVVRRAMEISLTMQARLTAQGCLSCQACGRLTDDPERVCMLCRLVRRAARHRTLLAALQASPWASLWDLRRTLPDVTPQEYGRLRALLIRTSWVAAQTWLSRNRSPWGAAGEGARTLPAEVVDALKLHVMLRTLQPWDRVDPLTVERYLGRGLVRRVIREGSAAPGARPSRPGPAGETSAPARPSPPTPD